MSDKVSPLGVAFGWGKLASIIALLCTAPLYPSLAAAANYATDDLYLKSLAEEADKLDGADQPGGKPAPAAVDSKKSAPRAVPVAADMKEFEVRLKRDFPSSYRLYKDLAPEKKMIVYLKYQETHRFTEAKLRIIDLYQETQRLDR